MKELIPKDDLGVFVDNHDTARVDSLFVAELFEKNHKEVLRDIRKITDPLSGLSEEFRQRNFAPSSYRNQQNMPLIQSIFLSHTHRHQVHQVPFCLRKEHYSILLCINP